MCISTNIFYNRHHWSNIDSSWASFQLTSSLKLSVTLSLIFREQNHSVIRALVKMSVAYSLPDMLFKIQIRALEGRIGTLLLLLCWCHSRWLELFRSLGRDFMYPGNFNYYVSLYFSCLQQLCTWLFLFICNKYNMC